MDEMDEMNKMRRESQGREGILAKVGLIQALILSFNSVAVVIGIAALCCAQLSLLNEAEQSDVGF